MRQGGRLGAGGDFAGWVASTEPPWPSWLLVFVTFSGKRLFAVNDGQIEERGGGGM